jgi:hypothetical protein
MVIVAPKVFEFRVVDVIYRVIESKFSGNNNDNERGDCASSKMPKKDAVRISVTTAAKVRMIDAC